jgi:hypothetical protein
MPEDELRELYEKGHQLLVEDLVRKIEQGTAGTGDRALFAQLMRQNNISVAQVGPGALEAALKLQRLVASKCQTFGALEEKRKVLPMRLGPTAEAPG